MVAQLDEDGEKACTCVEVEGTRSKRNSKKSGTEGLTNSDRAVYSAVCLAHNNDDHTYVSVYREVKRTAGEGTMRQRLYRDDCG